MNRSRKNWGEGFALGLLIGVVAAISCFSGRPIPRRIPQTPGETLRRLTGKERRAALLLAEPPSSTVH